MSDHNNNPADADKSQATMIQEKRMDSPDVGLAYVFSLACKDMWRNKRSTFLLISLICLICFPFLVLATLQANYVGYIRSNVESATPAKRLELVVENPDARGGGLTTAELAKIEQHPRVVRVVPHRQKQLEILNGDGELARFDAIAAVDGDPDLERLGFEGTFPYTKQAIILHEEHFQNLKLQPNTKTLNVVVSRFFQDELKRYVIPCQLMGSVKGGDKRVVYIPLQLANDLENWRMGFAIDLQGVQLPPLPTQEGALREPTFPAAIVYLPNVLDATAEAVLNPINLKLELLKNTLTSPRFDGVGYLATPTDGHELTEQLWNDKLNLVASRLGRPVVIPQLSPLSCTIGGQKRVLHATVPSDPRANDTLSAGIWLQHSGSSFDAILPDKLRDTFGRPPFSVTINGVNWQIPLNVIGTTHEPHGYVSPTLLFRLWQLERGEAAFDEKRKTFGLPDGVVPEPTYLIANVHVKSLDDIIPTKSWLEANYQGFIVSAMLHLIEPVKRITRMISNLVLLITIFGAIAIICATMGIMFEAIDRKRKQIGIMRTIGVPRNSILWLYIIQVIMSGGIGYLLASILQSMLIILDTERGHKLLGIDIPANVHIFQSDWRLMVIAGLAVLLICVISGLLPAFRARNVEPGIVLSELQ